MVETKKNNVTSKPKKNRSAAASVAGFEYQFDRMLYHLATAAPGTLVGIETADDISISQNSIISCEQDKFVIRKNKNPFANTSENLWKTLKIWADCISQSPSDNFRFLFASNIDVKRTPNSIIWKIAESKTVAEAKKCIDALQKTKPSKNRTIAKLMAQVKGYANTILESIIINASIAENTKMDDAQLVRVLEPPDGIVGQDLLYCMRGWVHSVVMNLWRAGQPGEISRKQYIDAKDRYCATQKRYRRLERPYRDIIISEEDKINCVSKTFVEQILAVKFSSEDVASDVIETAIENFIRFNSENSRLIMEGEITDREWGVFFDDLKNRWKDIQHRNVSVMQPNATRDEIGCRIYFDTLSDYKAPLDGLPTTELYLTHGGYHCLAEDVSVCWHPDFPLPKTKTVQ